MPETVPTRAAYSVAEAAHLLSISRQWLYRLLERGDVRSVHLGSRRLIPAEEIDRILAGESREAANG